MRSYLPKRLLITTFALALGLQGCASGGSGGSSAGSRNHIVQEELENLSQFDAYQAIQRLRPAWLRSRGGSEPTIFLDGNRQGGGLNVLRSMRVADIQEMEYLRARDATTRFGTNMDGGAILVTTKR